MMEVRDGFTSTRRIRKSSGERGLHATSRGESAAEIGTAKDPTDEEGEWPFVKWSEVSMGNETKEPQMNEMKEHEEVDAIH